MIEHKPAVSCICLTYARPELLEESIASFLQQEYRGPKELIVLNDYEQQILEFDHPEVRVINLPKRLRTVGEKMNMAVALASHDLLFVWDDDDIYLPHRLAFSVEQFDARNGFFKPHKAWFWHNGTLSGPAKNLFHAGSCWSRRLFDAVRGYVADGTGYAMAFERLLRQTFPATVTTYDIKPEEIYYIYRWSGSNFYDKKSLGAYKPGANMSHHEVAAFVEQAVAAGRIQQGRIQLQPHWRADYQQLVAAYIRSLPADQDQQPLFASILSGAF